jgi:hypothetical protein
MSFIEGFFDEIGFFESVCSSFEWSGDKLLVNFEKGIDIRGSDHPLTESLGVDEPCRVVFEGVVTSKLKVSKFVCMPNIFDVHYFEKDGLPEQDSTKSYEEFYMEGVMKATDPEGWFVWDIVAEKVTLNDLK